MKKSELRQIIREEIKSLFEDQNTEKKITVSLATKAVASFKRELNNNKIQYDQVKPTVFELIDTPKSRMAIQLTKERFGVQSVLVK